MNVNSVFGPVSTDSLGTTLMHEHVAIFEWSMRMSFGNRWMDVDKLAEYVGGMLKDARENYGIRTMVEGSVPNIGRDVGLMKRIADISGVNIIVSSGMYYGDEIFLRGKPAEAIESLLLYECSNGIQDTGIKPGILKCATDADGITPTNHMLLTAISRVQKKTGLPMFAHTCAALQVGLEQQALFEYNGVDLSRVIIGHCGDTNDLDYLEALLNKGCYIGMDRFGIGNGFNSLENRVETVYELCRRGWIDRLVLSQDCCPFVDWGQLDWSMVECEEHPMKEFNYTYMHRKAFPLLLEKGLRESDIEHMMVDNPKRFFEGKR